MRAKDVMSTKPQYVPSSTTLKKAAWHMQSHNFGFLPVGDNDKLIGAITDRDISIRATAKGKDPNKTTVKAVMTKKIQYCFEDDDLSKVVKQMESGKIRRLVVMDKNKRMTGIISLSDIATKCGDAALCSELVDAVSH